MHNYIYIYTYVVREREREILYNSYIISYHIISYYIIVNHIVSMLAERDILRLRTDWLPQLLQVEDMTNT